MTTSNCLVLGILGILGIGLTGGRMVRLDPNNHEEVIVFTGEKLNLRCTPKLQPKTSWYKDDDVLRLASSRIRIMNQTLRFKYVKLEDAGIYACQIENDDETVQWRNVSVRVESPQNDGYQNEAGELGSVLTALRPEEETNELDVETRNLPDARSLHLDSERADSDLKNEKGENETAGEHNKTVPESAPSFNKSDEMHSSIVKPAGSMVRLRCSSYANPTPNITWLKNNEEPRRALGSMSKGKWSVRLEDLVPSDSGNYTCIVCNLHGCINHTYKVDIIETVKHRPILTRPPRNATAIIGSNASMTCEVLSDAHRHLEWYHGYHKSFETVNKTNQNSRVEVKAGIAENPEVLNLYNVTEKDEGWYTCIAQNTIGETFSSAYLRVVENQEISQNSSAVVQIQEESTHVYVTVTEESEDVDTNVSGETKDGESRQSKHARRRSERKQARSSGDSNEGQREKVNLALSNNGKDEYDAFGVTVVTKLKKMKPEQRLYAENLINRILFQGILARLSPRGRITTFSQLNRDYYYQ